MKSVETEGTSFLASERGRTMHENSEFTARFRQSLEIQGMSL